MLSTIQLKKNSAKGKQANISRVPPLIPPRPSKSILAKSKFFKKDLVANSTSKSSKQSYVQASKDNIKNIVKIKENFLKLSVQKVVETHKILNNIKKERIMVKSNVHIFNINILLKEVKFDVSANFMCSNNKGTVITTNKVATSLDLNIMEKYIKEVNVINTSNIMSPSVVATTRHSRTNDLTTSKALQWAIK